MNERQKWVLYEKGKAILRNDDLTPEEYDKRLKILVDKLGL